VILRDTELAGCVLVELAPNVDERGFFARTFDEAEFAGRGLTSAVAQCSISYNAARGTLRGLHFQSAPWTEAKLVRCTRGRVFDVVADVRAGSPTFGRWTAVELSAENRTGIFIAEGLAHGFLTLEPESEVMYQISTPHHPEAFRGVRWDDPVLAIDWPAQPAVISDRDAELPRLDS
jgi:dTDP-4-dehydrorhamnose 3,5-epimerase